MKGRNAELSPRPETGSVLRSVWRGPNTEVVFGRGLTPQVAAIKRAAKRASALCLAARWAQRTGPPWIVASAVSPFVLMIVNALLKSPIDGIVLVFILPLLTPFLCAWMWMLGELNGFRKALRELSGIFEVDCDDVRHTVPLSAIGPLLEVLSAVTIAPYDRLVYDDIASPATLLGALLQSLRPEDAVVLTNFQRKRLHEIIRTTHSVWEEWGLVENGVCGKDRVLSDTLCRQLRPNAVGALGLLGNGSSIPVLERFVKQTDDSNLRQSALEAIEQIRKRVQYGSEEMLRACRAPERSNTLLRAASGDRPQPDDAQHLLRCVYRYPIFPETGTRRGVRFRRRGRRRDTSRQRRGPLRQCTSGRRT
ncbi:MAG: hypothetical protein JWL77_5266 [Chthonomonadaceae bacterium]|nr:hypothetical protein [Chthonomonadaceae bacterium]